MEPDVLHSARVSTQWCMSLKKKKVKAELQFGPVTLLLGMCVHTEK